MQTIAENNWRVRHEFEIQDIPAEVIHQAKRTITDTLGCAWAVMTAAPPK